MKRRFIVKGAALALLTSWAPAGIAQSSRRIPTPAQTEGPFYPTVLPPETDSDLLSVQGRAYRSGEQLLMRGTVEGVDGKPLVGAVVEIWQCDHDGHYHHPGDGGRANPDFQGFGRSITDAAGRYQFRTIKPVSYPGRTPHIHVKVRRGTRALLTTQMYVAGEPANERDGVLRAIRDPAQRSALVVALTRDQGHGSWTADFPLVVQG